MLNQGGGKLAKLNCHNCHNCHKWAYLIFEMYGIFKKTLGCLVFTLMIRLYACPRNICSPGRKQVFSQAGNK